MDSIHEHVGKTTLLEDISIFVSFKKQQQQEQKIMKIKYAITGLWPNGSHAHPTDATGVKLLFPFLFSKLNALLC